MHGREGPDTEGMKQMTTLYEVLWPQRQFVTAERLILWARDDVANGLCTDAQGFEAEQDDFSVDQAIAILNDTGTVTMGKGRRAA